VKVRRGKNIRSASKKGPSRDRELGDERQGVSNLKFSQIPLTIVSGTTLNPASIMLNDGDFQISANTIKMQPVSLGGRFLAMATLFQKWRIKRMRWRYVPSASMSGVLESTTAASPTYNVCQLVMGVVRDPGLNVGLTFGQAVDTGAKPFSSVRPATYNLKPTGWLYTADQFPTTVSIQDRFSSAGIFYVYSDAQLPNNITLGELYLEGEVQFSYPVPILNDARLPLQVSSDEDKSSSKGRVFQGSQGGARSRVRGDVPFYDGSRSTVFATPKIDQLVSHSVRLHQDAATSHELAKRLCSIEESFVNVGDSKESEVLGSEPALHLANSDVVPSMGKVIPASTGSLPPAIDILKYLTRLGFPAS